MYIKKNMTRELGYAIKHHDNGRCKYIGLLIFKSINIKYHALSRLGTFITEKNTNRVLQNEHTPLHNFRLAALITTN